MAKLDNKVKRYIVRALACYDTPSVVVAAVKDEFGLELIRQQVAAYDPTKAQGRELSKDLRTLFDTTRAQFLIEVDKIPLANQAYRLRALGRLFVQAESSKNVVMAAQLLEQAAKEVGGAYTNARRIQATGAGEGPIEHKHTYEHSDEFLAHIAAGGSPGAAPTPSGS